MLRYTRLLLLVSFITSVKSERNVSKVASSILDELVRGDKYDRRLRPNYGGKDPVEVTVSLRVVSMDLNDVKMELTLDMLMRQKWIDPRLKYSSESLDQWIAVSGKEYLKQLWTPDLFFPNEKLATSVERMTYDGTMRMTPDGRIMTSQRRIVTVACVMKLNRYPLDTQQCSLELESYGFKNESLALRWVHHDQPGSVELAATDHLSTYHVDENVQTTLSATDITEKGAYERLTATFTFHRYISFYLLHTYLPAILMVLMSYVAFWLHHTRLALRLMLAVVALLGILVVQYVAGLRVANVSYIRADDLYLGVCILLTLFLMIESVMIACPQFANSKGYSSADRMMLEDQDPLNSHRPGTATDYKRNRNPSAIDRLAHLVFVVAFIGFNIVYWLIYLLI